MSVMPEGIFPDGPELAPYKAVAAFLDANDCLVRSTVIAHAQPTVESLILADRFKKEAIESVAPMVTTQFFRGLGDGELISVAAQAVIKSTETLWQTATKIRPDDPTHFNFDDGLPAQVIEALSNEDQGDNATTDMASAVGFLSNTYEEAVRNIFQKLISADSVIAFGIDTNNRIERKKQRVNLGATVVAAFLGAGLAHLLTNRKGDL